MTYPPPNPVYLGPAAHTSEGSNKPIDRIVIHATVSPCVEGGARNVARYFRSARAARPTTSPTPARRCRLSMTA
jgi:hypothetical protein